MPASHKDPQGVAIEEITRRSLFIIGRQRSGTTVLRQALASHPRVRDLAEVMHAKRKDGFYAVLTQTLVENRADGLHHKWGDVLVEAIRRLSPPPGDEIVLVDIKYNMALSFGMAFDGAEPVNVFARFLRRQQASAIHIVRRNKLALLTSHEVARATNQWARKPGEEARFEQVTMMPQALRTNLRREEAMDAYFTAQMARVRGAIAVVYEEMFAPDGTFVAAPFEQVARQMGIEPTFDLRPSLARQARPLSETIRNFDEVVALVEGMIAAGELPPAYHAYLRS